MKNVWFLLVLIVAAGCGVSDNCVKSTGNVTVRQVDVSQTPFNKVSVFPGIALVVRQGSDAEVKIESGANIIDDVSAKVENGMLTLRDESGCNLVRAYGQTKVYVTSPNIEEIYSNTEKDIVSDGMLNYPILRLISMDFFGGVGTGDFHIAVDNGQVVVQSNHVAGFYVTGHTNQLLLDFYDGIGRFEGAGLLAEEIKVFHRGSNDMIVHPVQSLTGDIYSTGNLISTTQPPTVNVIEHWSGRLIFE